MRRDSLYGKKVTLTVRYSEFNTFTKQKTLSQSINSGNDIFRRGLEIFRSISHPKPIRLLGIGMSLLEKEWSQLGLFDRKRRRITSSRRWTKSKTDSATGPRRGLLSIRGSLLSWSNHSINGGKTTGGRASAVFEKPCACLREAASAKAGRHICLSNCRNETPWKRSRTSQARLPIHLMTRCAGVRRKAHGSGRHPTEKL